MSEMTILNLISLPLFCIAAALWKENKIMTIVIFVDLIIQSICLLLKGF